MTDSRVSRESADVLDQNDDPSVIVSRESLDVLNFNDDLSARISRESVDILDHTDVMVQLTRISVDVLIRGTVGKGWYLGVIGMGVES